MCYIKHTLTRFFLFILAHTQVQSRPLQPSSSASRHPYFQLLQHRYTDNLQGTTQGIQGSSTAQLPYPHSQHSQLLQRQSQQLNSSGNSRERRSLLQVDEEECMDSSSEDEEIREQVLLSLPSASASTALPARQPQLLTPLRPLMAVPHDTQTQQPQSLLQASPLPPQMHTAQTQVMHFALCANICSDTHKEQRSRMKTHTHDYSRSRVCESVACSWKC